MFLPEKLENSAFSGCFWIFAMFQDLSLLLAVQLIQFLDEENNMAPI